MRIYEEINALPPAGIGNLLPKKILASLRNRRNEFRIIVKKQAEANEAAWTSAKTQLEADWGRFETEVQKYVESFGAQINQQRATFKLQAEAQLKARREVAHKFQATASGFPAERRSEIDATITHMKADAATADDSRWRRRRHR